MPIGIPAAIIGAAVVGAGATVASSAMASSAQKSAAQNAINAQQQMFATTQQNLQPFQQYGAGAIPQMQTLTGTGPGGNPLTAPLTAPFQPTMAQLAATPGYQFTRQQGLEATQNAFAAQGLGSSGAAMKGAAGYAEGLASTTYQQQLQNYLAQNAQTYNMLQGEIGTGLGAAQGLAGAATTTGQGIAQSQTNIGQAQAGALTASGQAVGNAANAVPTALLLGQMYQNNPYLSGAFATSPNSLQYGMLPQGIG